MNNMAQTKAADRIPFRHAAATPTPPPSVIPAIPSAISPSTSTSKAEAIPKARSTTMEEHPVPRTPEQNHIHNRPTQITDPLGRSPRLHIQCRQTVQLMRFDHHLDEGGSDVQYAT